MPTNLPPEAKKKWAEVETTQNPRSKLELMQEFLSLVPKHKGTTKLCAQVKKKMATIRKEIDEKKQKRAGKGGPKFFIEKEGAAQIGVLGLTNVGKSCLLSVLTNARIEVSPNPYTTREPTPSMMNYADVQFQLVEAPALMEGAADGRAWGLQTLALARNADGLILMVDLSKDPVNQLNLIVNEFEKARILFSKPKGRVLIERKHTGAGLRVIMIGKLVGCTLKNVKELLRGYRIADANVKISGEVTLDDVEDAIFENTTYKPVVVVANKIDVNSSKPSLELLEATIDKNIPLVAISCQEKLGLEKLGETLFKTLNLIRIYTKEPGSRACSKKPFALKKGATLQDLAKSIHTDFERKFAHARVWSERLAFSPRKVGLSFKLEDGDIVEIVTKRREQ